MARSRRRFVARNRKQTTLRLGLLLGGAALVAALLFFGLRAFKGGGKTVPLKSAPFGPEDAYAYTGKGFLYYQAQKLRYTDDTDGKKDFELSVNTSSGELGIAAGGNISALYNASFIVITGAEAPVEVEGTISRVQCGSNHFAALITGADNRDSLAVYDAKGALTDQMNFTNGYLLQYGLDTLGEETLWTLTLDDSGGLPISSITTYNLDQAVTNGLMSLQNQLIEDVRFTQNSVFAVGTDHIVRYSRSGNAEAYRVLVYGWKALDFLSGERPVFLLGSRAEDGFNSVRILSVSEGDTPEERIATVQLPEGTLSAFLCGGKLAVFTPETLYLYDTNGTRLSETALGYTISEAVKLSPNKALLTAGQEMLVLNLGGR